MYRNMNELKERINILIESMTEVTELFYQQKNKEGYTKFSMTIELIASIVENIFLYKKDNPDIEINENEITESLRNAMQAMEEKDTVLLADILQYELIEKLNEIKSLLK